MQSLCTTQQSTLATLQARAQQQEVSASAAAQTRDLLSMDKEHLQRELTGVRDKMHRAVEAELQAKDEVCTVLCSVHMILVFRSATLLEMEPCYACYDPTHISVWLMYICVHLYA